MKLIIERIYDHEHEVEFMDDTFLVCGHEGEEAGTGKCGPVLEDAYIMSESGEWATFTMTSTFEIGLTELLGTHI